MTAGLFLLVSDEQEQFGGGVEENTDSDPHTSGGKDTGDFSMKPSEGPDGNAAALCIRMTTDNGSLAILNSSIHAW